MVSTNTSKSNTTTTASTGSTGGRPLLHIEWGRMYWMIMLCTMFHIIGSICALCQLYAAVYIGTSLGYHLNMVTSPGEGGVLPGLLSIVGVGSALLHLPQAILVLRSMQHRTLKGMNQWLRALVLINCIWSVLLLVIATVALLHSYHLHDKVRDGLIEAMLVYKNNSVSKRAIDMLQVQFQCCGSHSYKDWFNIPWFDADLANLPDNASETRDDVPFSCCSMSALAPCVHQGVAGGRGGAGDYLYAPERNITISQDGCHEALSKGAKTLAWLVAIALLATSVYQVVVCIVTRLVQTGHSGLGEFNRKQPSICWLVTGRPKTKDQDKPAKKKKKLQQGRKSRNTTSSTSS